MYIFFTALSRHFAYVWYYHYTMPEYACSATVAMRRLQALRARSLLSRALNVDYVLVYSALEQNKRWTVWFNALLQFSKIFSSMLVVLHF